MIIDADFSAQTFMPQCFEDWIKDDHPARLIRDYVDGLDMKALGFKFRESAEGAPSYAPQLLLRVWLFGYFNKIRTSRKMEAMCAEMLGAKWLAGNHAPDHNTIWRFFNCNQPAISALYKNMLFMAAKNSQVGFVAHALDGTRILAAASKRGAIYEEDLLKAEAQLDEWIAEMASDIEEAGEGDQIRSGYHLEGKLKEVRARRKEIKASLELLKEKGAKAHLPREPQAVLVGKRSKWSYNAQATCDEATGLVVAADVTSDVNDAHQLKRMLEQAEENLGKRPEATLVDSGYSRSHDELKKTADAGHRVITSLQKKDLEPYATCAFRVEEKPGGAVLVCPREQQLEHVGTTAWRTGDGQMRVFRCDVHAACPSAHLCMAGRKSKTLHISPAHDIVRQHINSLDADVRKGYMRRRRQLIEPRFGHVKWNLDFTRFTYTGREAATAQWRMIWLVENLKTLHRKLGLRGVLAALTDPNPNPPGGNPQDENLPTTSPGADPQTPKNARQAKPSQRQRFELFFNQL